MSHLPRLVAIAGHPRSGTTLLTQLLNSHPEASITFELRAFQSVGAPLAEYTAGLRDDWRRRRLVEGARARPRWDKLASAAFLWRFRGALAGAGPGPVDVSRIAAAYRRARPRASVAGDKFPAYVFELDRLVELPGVRLVVIHRDCRDVVRSVLKEVAGAWRGQDFARRLDTPEKIAGNWVRAMDLTARHQARIHVVRYETLVARPAETLEALGAWLELSPSGFDAGRVRTDRVGGGARDPAPDVVLELAGDALRRFGYEA